MIDNPPPAPDQIPQYIADGMHRQGPQSLAAIEEYARTLQATIEEQDEKPMKEDELADANEGVVDVEKKGG